MKPFTAAQMAMLLTFPSASITSTATDRLSLFHDASGLKLYFRISLLRAGRVPILSPFTLADSILRTTWRWM